jgi:hypothetical protein
MANCDGFDMERIYVDGESQNMAKIVLQEGSRIDYFRYYFLQDSRSAVVFMLKMGNGYQVVS